MHIILLKDVAGVGKRDAIKDVKDGYAINFLIPRGLAQEASARNIALHDKRQKLHEEEARTEDAQFKELSQKISADKIVIKVRVNESGRPYENISAKRIASEIARKYKLDISESSIVLGEPIKGIGAAKIEIKLGRHRAVADVEVVAV